jgi:hypothetical protein
MSIEADPRRVFFLLQTDPGRAGEAQTFLQATAGISTVAATSGPFDLIATAEVGGTVALERLVGECRRTPGLTRMSRCHSAKS